MTAVASGAVLRTLNKQQGPTRKAYSSFGFLRIEPFSPDKIEGHRLTKPLRDEVDGEEYVTVIDYFMVKVSQRSVSLLFLLTFCRAQLSDPCTPFHLSRRTTHLKSAILFCSVRKCCMSLISLPSLTLPSITRKTKVNPYLSFHSNKPELTILGERRTGRRKDHSRYDIPSRRGKDPAGLASSRQRWCAPRKVALQGGIRSCCSGRG